MRRLRFPSGILTFTILLFPAFCSAQAKSGSAQGKNGSTVDFPCKLTSYRIPDKQTLAVLCDTTVLPGLTADFALYKLLDESVVYPAVAGATAAKSGSGSTANEVQVEISDNNWLVFRFNHDMEPEQNYELRFTGSSPQVPVRTPEDPRDHFSATRFRFSTSVETAMAKDITGKALLIQSTNVGLAVAKGAKLVDHSSQDKAYALSLAEKTGYDGLNTILLDPRTDSLGTKLELQGVTDVFGRTVTLKPYKPAPPAAAPKSKDAAAWYFNLLHQAGAGVTPSWIADIKAAPVLGAMPHQLFFTPSLNVDVGSGQVGTTKTNDIINPMVGVSRLFVTDAGILNAVKITPSLSYQTNREQTNRAVLFDGDMRFYFKQLSNTKADRTLDNFWKLRRGDPKKNIAANPKALPQDAKKAIFGYDIQFYFGAEAGSSLTANLVKSSDKSSSVTVPSYSIVRLRPRASATFEFWNLTLSLSATPRYLLNTEAVTRETTTIHATSPATKTISLSSVSGWRGYSETSLSYAIDQAGHYSVNATYKLGSLPTNFGRTNLVQSGLLVRF
jgi:hypothetical protein